MLSSEQLTRIKEEAKNNPCYGINIYGREFINKHLKKLEPGEIFLELGTWMGGTLQFLAKQNPHLAFHSIDLCDGKFWKTGYADNPLSGLYYFLKDCNIDNILPCDIIEVQKAHLDGLSNVTTYAGESTSLDLNNIGALLIDANHIEKYVIAELEYYFPRMKKNRFIFLDDFYVKDVKSAIIKFRQNREVKFKGYGDVALIYT